MTVVFADLAESTALGEKLDPESLRHLLNRYFEQMKSICERHGGIVREFIGDAVMAVFGAPLAHEDDALRAVRAAAEMRERLIELNAEFEAVWGVRLAVRIGANTGEVVTGESASESQTLVLGDAVNVAARLEQVAVPGEILLGEQTYRLVAPYVAAEPLTSLTLKGKTTQTRAHRLLELRETAGLEGAGAPIVGRERELSVALEAYDRATDGRTAHVLTIVGAAGIGKTRLAQELVTLVGHEARVLAGRCPSYGEGLTFRPLAEMVGHEHGTDIGLRLRELLGPAEDVAEIEEPVSRALGAAEGTLTTRETFWALRRLLELAAGEDPLVCVFENFQRAEPTLLDLIEYIGERSRGTPVLLVCLARPELLDLRPDWMDGRSNATTLRLEPLDDGRVRELVDRLAETSRLAPGLRTRITRAAEGNPLFAEQLVAEFAEADAGDDAVMPPVIQALLAARVDRLPQHERRLLEVASVEGDVFHPSVLAELAGEEELHVRAQLLGLIQKDLIRPARATIQDEDAFRFQHGLVREAAHRRLPKTERAILHARFADVLERMGRAWIGELDGILGYHLYEAYRCRSELGLLDAETSALATRAAERLAAAGRRAIAHGDGPSAAGLLGRAAKLLPHEDALRAGLVSDLALATFETGRLREAVELAEEAIEVARKTGEVGIEWHASLLRSFWGMFIEPERVDLDEVLRVTEEAADVFERLDDPLGLLRAWSLRWEVWQWRGETERQTEVATRSIELAERVASPPDQNWAVCNFGFTLLDGPMPLSEAIAQLGAWRERTSDRASRAMLDAFLDAARALAGDVAHAQASVARSEEVAEAYLTEASRVLWGRVAMTAGDYVAAERQLRLAWESAEASGDSWFGAIAAVELARALLELGRVEEALACVAGIDEAGSAHDPEILIKRRAVLGRVYAEIGRFADADAVSAEAVVLGEGTGFLVFRADALLDRAAVLRASGREAEAAALAEEAFALYAEKDCDPPPPRLKSALELAPSHEPLA